MSHRPFICWMACVLAFALAVPGTAQEPVELYSDDDFQYVGLDPTDRAQQFRATTSLPENDLTPAHTFSKVAVRIYAPEGSSVSFKVYLYRWNRDYAFTLLIETPLGQTIPLRLADGADEWVQVTCPPQPADGIYLVLVRATAATGEHWGIRRSSSDDGGPDNEAYNDGNLMNNREYQVRLDGIAAPPDMDGDGIPDTVEGWPPVEGQSHRLLADSDGDGLSDSDEDQDRNGVRRPNETSTRDADSDDDRLMDGIERRILLSDPLNPADAALFTDNDADGLPQPHDPDDADLDSDGDRFTDAYEAAVLSAAAAGDAGQTPPLGDVNRDTAVSNLDALVVQSLFLGNIGPESPVFGERGFSNADPSRDGFISNIDALLLQAFFLGNRELLPL